MRYLIVLFFIFTSLFTKGQNFYLNDTAYYSQMTERLQKLFKPPVRSRGDWISYVANKEKAQFFKDYWKSNPSPIDTAQQKIYIQAIGTFSQAQEQILKETAVYLKLYFGLETILMPSILDTIVPAKARRVRESEQLLTTYILYEYLKPLCPPDAAAFIAFTSKDVYPADNWNYAFGQASLYHKIGVWSVYRFGNPAESTDAYEKCFLRAIKTATHELGHIFGITHCRMYHCNMGGSINLAEMDSKPVFFCPECLAKITWRMQRPMQFHFQNLHLFWNQRQHKTLAAFYKSCLDRMW